MRAFVITIAFFQTLAVGVGCAKAGETSGFTTFCNAAIGAWAWWLVLA